MLALCLNSNSKQRTGNNYDVIKNIQKVGRLLLTSRDQHFLLMPTLLFGVTLPFVIGDFSSVRMTSFC